MGIDTIDEREKWVIFEFLVIHIPSKTYSHKYDILYSIRSIEATELFSKNCLFGVIP